MNCITCFLKICHCIACFAMLKISIQKFWGIWFCALLDLQWHWITVSSVKLMPNVTCNKPDWQENKRRILHWTCGSATKYKCCCIFLLNQLISQVIKWFLQWRMLQHFWPHFWNKKSDQFKPISCSSWSPDANYCTFLN